MPELERTPPVGATQPGEHDEIHNEDFQFVLKRLLEAYRPVLEEELRRAGAPEELKREALERPPSCEEEIALANRIFENFLTDEVAIRLLSPEGRQQLGPVEQWRWCLLHIRCCIIFGWLVCRGPRTFRAFAYYLYRYWVCVRQALGASVEFPDAVPDAVIDGSIDCFEGEEEAAAIFERLLTLDTAPALLGKAAFD